MNYQGHEAMLGLVQSEATFHFKVISRGASNRGHL